MLKSLKSMEWEDETQFRIEAARKILNKTQDNVEIQKWQEYIESLEKALKLEKQWHESRECILVPEHLRQQSTWNNLQKISCANHGLLCVVDAVTIFVEAAVFLNRKDARNNIYSTLFYHKNSIQRIRKGIYQIIDWKKAKL